MSVVKVRQRSISSAAPCELADAQSRRAAPAGRAWGDRGGTMPLFELPERIRREIGRLEPDAPNAWSEVSDDELCPAPSRSESAVSAATPPPLAHVSAARGPVTASLPAASVAASAAEGRPAVRSPDSPLFRHEALRAYSMGAKLSSTLQVVPVSTRVLLATLAAAVLAALAVAGFGEVDLTAKGRGTMRAVTGVQALVFPIEGMVREVLVHDGELVEAGQVLVRLDSTQLSAGLQEAEEHMRTVQERARRDESVALRAYEREAAVIARRGGLLRARIASQGRSLVALDRERVQYGELAAQGYVADKTRRDSEEQLLHERRNLLATQDEAARLAQQLTALEQSRQAGIAGREQQLRDATTRRDAARRMLAQTELRASRAGRVESLVVSEGDLVGAQKVVARLVPRTAGKTITAFLPERERAFVRSGATVRVEFDQLPVGEFGSVAARVLRVSSEVAARTELEQALGSATPEGVWFSVSVELLDEPRTGALVARLGSGSLVTVRLPVRRRRILALVFDPVRKWLD